MTARAQRVGRWLAALVVGLLYAVLFCLIRSHLLTAILVSPLWILVFWFLFSKLGLVRFAGYAAAVPLALFAFEAWWSVRGSATAADRFKSTDRSHYLANTRQANPTRPATAPDHYGWDLHEILIGPDGFRADPATGRGNPERCTVALIGDSMVYGSGLPYSSTLGPVLKTRGIEACVFGVTGNSPVDYLATLEYVAERIEPGGCVAIYLYAYNDFVTLRKYYGRKYLGLSKRFPALFRSVDAFDEWRRSTFLYNLLHGERKKPASTLWQYGIGGAQPIRLLSAQDPGTYRPPSPLGSDQKVALSFFLKRLEEVARSRSWRVYLIIHPDYPEIFANLARRSTQFVDLDPRRAEVLQACKTFPFVCDDVSGYLYARALQEAKSPYFVDDRHFSAFGTQVLAEHLATLLKADATRANSE